MAVFFRVGAIIPCFRKEMVEKARSTEDLIQSTLELHSRVIPGRLADSLKLSGEVYIDDFNSFDYRRGSCYTLKL